jgi:hypothetical protein
VALLSRRLAALGMVAATLYITQGQEVDLTGLNFMAIRFVEVAAFFRILSRQELSAVRFTRVDRWLIIFFITYVGMLSLRTGVLDTYALGGAVDAWLVFFIFRALIITPEEFKQFMHGMVFLLVPYAILMTIEATRAYNLFSLMGGVPAVPEFREGHYRCQGGFRCAITAGTLGSTFLPLFIGFLFQRENRWWAITGITASIAILLASHSSGPLMAAFIAFAAWGCWFVRRRMTFVRKGIVGTLFALNMMMSAPVWFIFDRLSGIFGGDGWHRSNLIDKFIKHFNEWWFAGMPMENTADWAATKTPWGSVDVTNYYVSVGLNGGLIPFVFFIVVIVQCFKLVGRGLEAVRAQNFKNNHLEAMIWGAGSAVCAHVVNMTAVIYWDQSYVIWYLQLALATSLGQFALSHLPVQQKDHVPVMEPEGVVS